jgi:PPM family protein phosphatase
MTDNYFGITDTGRIRDNNEDNFIAEPVMGGRMIAACVIDGVGGYEGGEVAAQITKDTILSQLKRDAPNHLQALREAFKSSNRQIQEGKSGTGTNQNMACVVTIALVDLKENKFYYAHVGDTRLYLFRDQSLVKITSDQSFVGFLEDSGRLTEEEAMSHPKRNEINKALGFDDKIETQDDYIETGESPFLPGDMIMLCSDGLSDMVAQQKMISLLNAGETLEEKAGSLVNAANEAGGKDNITVVLVKNSKKTSKQKATKPVLVKKKDLPAAVEDAPVSTEIQTKKRKGKGVLFLLAAISLVSIATSVWLFRELFVKGSANDTEETITPTAIVKNQNEIALQDSINNSVQPFLLLSPSVFGDTIKLTDTIWINRETLYLKGPVVFYRDSNFLSGGPALAIGKNCKYIMLDSIEFSGFDLALLAGDPAVLQMRDLKFPGTKLSVAYTVPDSVVRQRPAMNNDSVLRNKIN